MVAHWDPQAFEILDSSNNIVNENNGIYEICASETVNFDDTTSYELCDGSIFNWVITSVGPDNIPNTSASRGLIYLFTELLMFS